MTRTWKTLCGALFASALVLACTDATGDASSSAAVSDPADGGTRPPPPRPPKEAFDACASKAADDACAFDFDGHHVTGTCSHGPDGNGPLACKPDHPPPPPKPPQEALDACASLAAGAACSFTLAGQTIDGTCIAPPDGSATLACAPDQMHAP